MASCRLCGYTARLDKNAVAQQQQEQCVVCGEAFGGDDGRRSGGATQQAASLLAHAGGAIWRGASPKQEMSQPPVPAMGRCVGAETNQSSWLNPELRLLLDLVPQQQNRRKRTQDSVRAIGNLTPPRVDEVPSDPEVVFIRPRADPTMRVLKGRYKTQPRAGRATSMSALHRLSHPLIGYDSMKALAPKARRRRQESAERILERGFAREDASSKGHAARHFNRTHSSAEVSRPSARNARIRRRSYRGSSRNSGTSAARPALIATSVNAVHLQRRDSVASTTDTKTGSSLCGRGRRCDEARRKRETSCQSSRRSPGSPALLFRLRESGGRRAKPTLRRKRVATMRSVNGWVREADPASVGRQVPLDRRVLALGRKTVGEHAAVVTERDGRAGNICVRRFSGGGSSGGGDATFLTALDTDGATVNGDQGGNAQPTNRAAEGVARTKAGSRRPRGGVGKIASVHDKRGRQQQQVARRASRAGRRSSSAENGGCKSGVVEEILRKARERVGETRGSSGTKSCGALGRRIRPREAVPAGPADTETGRLEQGMLRRWATTREDKASQPARNSEGCHVGLSRTRGAGGDDPADPKAWKALLRRRPGESLAQGKALLEATSSGGKSNANTTKVGMAPAWGTPELHPATQLGGENGIRVSRQGGDTSIATTDRLRNPWWRLREGAEPTSHSASVLQSFDNKFTASAMPPADKPLRETRGGPRLAQQPPDSGAQQRQRPQQASPAGTHLAGTNQRLPSREWVQRRSLPSLLTADANASPSIPSTPAAPSRAAAATAAKRRRGKASGHGEPTGRMQRLDKTATTVADAWGGGASAARHRNRSAESSMTSPATATTNAAVRKQATAALGSVDARESAGMVHHRAVCGTSSGRDLLSSAVSEPLLYVGNGGGGFRLRSF